MDRLIQFQCQREGTLFYYQTGVRVCWQMTCPVCGSKRVEETGRTFPPVAESNPVKGSHEHYPSNDPRS